MKARRQMKIIEAVRNNLIETQEELARHLSKEGIEVTQATISRDIKDLNLIKTPTGDGRYRYSIPDNQQSLLASEKLKRLFTNCCLGLDYSDNIVVIRTLTGTAPGVGEAVDALRIHEVLGTVAGDNTVILVVRDQDAAINVMEKLGSLIQ